MLPRAVRSSGVTAAALESRRTALGLLCRPLPAYLPWQSRSRVQRAFTSAGSLREAQPEPTIPHHVSVREASAQALIRQTVPTSIVACSGCGALAQTVEPGEAGFYDVSRSAVKDFVKTSQRTPPLPNIGSRNGVFDAATSAIADSDLKAELVALKRTTGSTESPTPLCDRCHHLLHHNTGSAIAHPSVQSINDTILESPYTDNHIYHVIDAADFPLSFNGSIVSGLSVNQKLSRNRRGHDRLKYKHGMRTTIGYIVTRSDLLAPKKAQVDALMPYLTRVLRDRISKGRNNVRLGDVHCVSAKRGWWTSSLKDQIRARRGATWMVGKVNVGKSNLIEAVYPKAKIEDFDANGRKSSQSQRDYPEQPDSGISALHSTKGSSLLPPAKAEVPYPVMPTVSALPGTTASPIRLLYGNGHGELIDLPGLERVGLEEFVEPQHRAKLVMKSRPRPQKYSLITSKSLVIGGLVRISPKTEGLTFLAYTFTPLEDILRSDASLAEEKDKGNPSPPGTSIARAGVMHGLQSAGEFQLKWDVTRSRAGPLTRRDAIGLKVQRLPFRVFSTDIVIEGVGWVELSVQVRRKAYPIEDDDARMETERNEQIPAYPSVEVFSPEGRFVAAREPMGTWELCKPTTKK